MKFYTLFNNLYTLVRDLKKYFVEIKTSTYKLFYKITYKLYFQKNVFVVL